MKELDSDLVQVMLTKKIGKGIISITLLQALAALVFVDIALSVFCLCTKSFNEHF